MLSIDSLKLLNHYFGFCTIEKVNLWLNQKPSKIYWVGNFGITVTKVNEKKVWEKWNDKTHGEWPVYDGEIACGQYLCTYNKPYKEK